MKVGELLEILQGEDIRLDVVAEGVTTRHPLYRIIGVNRGRSGDVGGIVLTLERIPGENTLKPSEKDVLEYERDRIASRLRSMRAREHRELQYKITSKERALRSPAENLILDVMTDMGLRKRRGRGGMHGKRINVTPPRKKKVD